MTDEKKYVALAEPGVHGGGIYVDPDTYLGYGPCQSNYCTHTVAVDRYGAVCPSCGLITRPGLAETLIDWPALIEPRSGIENRPREHVTRYD